MGTYHSPDTNITTDINIGDSLFFLPCQSTVNWRLPMHYYVLFSPPQAADLATNLPSQDQKRNFQFHAPTFLSRSLPSNGRESYSTGFPSATVDIRAQDADLDVTFCPHWSRSCLQHRPEAFQEVLNFPRNQLATVQLIERERERDDAMFFHSESNQPITDGCRGLSYFQIRVRLMWGGFQIHVVEHYKGTHIYIYVYTL